MNVPVSEKHLHDDFLRDANEYYQESHHHQHLPVDEIADGEPRSIFRLFVENTPQLSYHWDYVATTDAKNQEEPHVERDKLGPKRRVVVKPAEEAIRLGFGAADNGVCYRSEHRGQHHTAGEMSASALAQRLYRSRRARHNFEERGRA